MHIKNMYFSTHEEMERAEKRRIENTTRADKSFRKYALGMISGVCVTLGSLVYSGCEYLKGYVPARSFLDHQRKLNSLIDKQVKVASILSENKFDRELIKNPSFEYELYHKKRLEDISSSYRVIGYLRDEEKLVSQDPAILNFKASRSRALEISLGGLSIGLALIGLFGNLGIERVRKIERQVLINPLKPEQKIIP